MDKHVLAAAVTLVLASSTAAAQQPDQGGAEAAPPVAEVTAVPPQAADSDEGFVEKAKAWADKYQIIERLNGDIDGWYPRLGGMTRGSGFAIGPGYRLHVGNVLVDASMGWSMKAYSSADVNVRWLQAFDDRLELWTNYRYEDFPQEDFFGMGPSSVRSARTSYDFDSVDVLTLALLKPVRWLELGTQIGYMSPDVGAGSDSNYPSLEQLFSDVDAPGFLEQPDFLHTTFFADVDYRDQKGRPRRGGFYHVAMSLWDDRTLEQYDFKRFDANVSQYVPVDPDRKHVLLGRVGLSYANNERGGRVPFYFLPYVGGVDTVRSFHEFRFKDENAIWMTAEYSWAPIKWVSVATFIDAGKVAPDWQDIRLSGLKKGYGFGVRVHSTTQTFARLDVGTGGGEGWQLFLKLGPSF